MQIDDVHRSGILSMIDAAADEVGLEVAASTRASTNRSSSFHRRRENCVPAHYAAQISRSFRNSWISSFLLQEEIEQQ